MDAQRLLEQFLGSGGSEFGTRTDNGAQNGASGPWDNARAMAERFTSGPMGGFGGGMAAGSLLGLLVGNKKVRKFAGGAVGYGGAAALGALAYRAYQNWQEGKAVAKAPAAAERDIAPAAGFAPPMAADGRPFALALILAMIGAAKADGHIGQEEQAAIFAKVNALDLDAESKAFVFDALASPIDIGVVAGMSRGLEQGAEIYIAARLAIDPDHPAEKSYLETLARGLQLPHDLVAHLERQVAPSNTKQGQ